MPSWGKVKMILIYKDPGCGIRQISLQSECRNPYIAYPACHEFRKNHSNSEFQSSFGDDPFHCIRKHFIVFNPSNGSK